MKQNFVAWLVQLLKHWLCHVQSGIVVENWALSVDQCQLQVLQFSVHLIDLLSILLRCNGFTGIQKSVVDKTGSRPPNSDHDLLLVQAWLWEVLWSFFSVQPLSSVQFSSVSLSCLTLCDPMNNSMPGLPVHHQLWVSCIQSTLGHMSQSSWETVACCCTE